MSETAEKFRMRVERMDASQLRDYQAELEQRLWNAAVGSLEARFADVALRFVEAFAERELAHGALRETCRRLVPVADPDAFADAMFALIRAGRELGIDDPAGVFAGALEVARRRGEASEFDDGSTEGTT